MIILVGFLASFTSTISLIPQIYKTYKSHSVEDLSFLMLLNFLACSILWVVYGYLTKSYSVLITNVIMTLFSTVLLWFKLRYRRESSI